MAGRVPLNSNRTAVAKEMEAVFVQNLNYAADVLSKVGDVFVQQNYNSEQHECSKTVF